MRTEKLNMTVKIGASSQFHNIFFEWWDVLGLEGRGLLVGTNKLKGERQKNVIRNRCPKVLEILSLDIDDSDIVHDMTSPLPEDVGMFDWAVCQAMLEHVTDPVATLRNTITALNENGYLYLHSHGPAFGEHRKPIDCYRFNRDAIIAWADILDINIVDMWWGKMHFFVVYRKVNG